MQYCYTGYQHTRSRFEVTRRAYLDKVTGKEKEETGRKKIVRARWWERRARAEGEKIKRKEECGNEVRKWEVRKRENGGGV